jgi:uncharacterized protein
MFDRFGLVLMVNHACNLRCTYCYTGRKFHRAMPGELAHRAIQRALASIRPNGTLELGFFGGEPLIEAELICNLTEFASAEAASRHIDVACSVTTNGTLAAGAAWELLTRDDIDLTISFDGLPKVHDRHRVSSDGSPTSRLVLATIERLVERDRAFRVIVVVRPDNLEEIAESIVFLNERGVRYVDLSLDLWTRWSVDDITCLGKAIKLCGKLWRAGLPDRGISWFDEKAAELCDAQKQATARCGFGRGEIAVAPSGRMYPCERLIGEDRDEDPMQLGHVVDCGDFLAIHANSARDNDECNACAMQGVCNTNCRCSNYVRTKDIRSPDALLCAWNQACLMETAAALGIPAANV